MAATKNATTLLTADSPRIRDDVPVCGGAVRLAPHQRAMVRRCLEIERDVVSATNMKGQRLLMTDAPGTGKTYVALALALVTPSGVGDTVVVVPEHIFGQWVAAADAFESQTTTPCESLTTTHAIDSYKAMMTFIDSDADPAKNKLVITTRLYVPLLNAHYDRIQRGPFRVMVDEDHRLLSPPSSDSSSTVLFQKASASWLISASPPQDQTSQEFRHEVRCEDEFVRRSFAEAFEWSAYRSAEVSYVRCRNVLTSRVLIRLFHGPTLDAYFACDFGVSEKKSLRVASASALLAGIKADVVASIAEADAELGEIRKRRKRATTADVERLTSTLGALRTTRKRLLATLSQAGVCTRCVRPIVERAAFRPGCDEMELFCEACTLEKRCVLCGDAECGIAVAGDVHMYPPEDVNVGNDKAAVLCRLIAAAPTDARIVVASSYARSFEILRETPGFPAADRVAETPEEFARDPTKRVFLLDANLHALGANLHATTDMVFFHRFLPELERQILGRALRPPRCTKLRLWHLRYDAEHVVLTGALPP